MGFESELLQEMAEKYALQLEQNDTECPVEGCSSTQLDAEIWVTDSGNFDGEVRCMSCNTVSELNIEDSDAVETANDVAGTMDDLKDTLDDF